MMKDFKSHQESKFRQGLETALEKGRFNMPTKTSLPKNIVNVEDKRTKSSESRDAKP